MLDRPFRLSSRQPTTHVTRRDIRYDFMFFYLCFRSEFMAWNHSDKHLQRSRCLCVRVCVCLVIVCEREAKCG